MKLLLCIIFLMVGVIAGSGVTYFLMQQRILVAIEEGSVGEAAAMSELLAIKASEIDNLEKLRETVFFISCRSSNSALEYVKKSGESFSGAYLTRDRAQHAQNLYAKSGLKHCL